MNCPATDRGVDQTRCDEPGINAHYDGASGAFTAQPPNGTARAGGPSIDQVIRRTHYPEGFPPGVVPTLLAGTFFRRNDRLTRFVQSFHEDGTPGGEGIDMPLDRLVEAWRLMADLYASAIQMDRARFGCLTFLAAGERIRLKGDYSYQGRSIFQFDDAAQHRASGAAGCSHEWWHKFDETKENQALRAHAHLKMRELAYFLSRLDSPDCREANGRTVLENSLITITTESGDGRHNDPRRELSGVFHAITGAQGRFKTGHILDVNSEGLDLYNTLLETMGASRRLGPAQRDPQPVNAIRA